MVRSNLPRQYARTRRFTLGAPHDFTIAPDGDAGADDNVFTAHTLLLSSALTAAVRAHRAAP